MDILNKIIFVYFMVIVNCFSLEAMNIKIFNKMDNDIYRDRCIIGYFAKELGKNGEKAAVYYCT